MSKTVSGSSMHGIVCA